MEGSQETAAEVNSNDKDVEIVNGNDGTVGDITAENDALNGENTENDDDMDGSLDDTTKAQNRGMLQDYRSRQQVEKMEPLRKLRNQRRSFWWKRVL